MDDSRQSLPFEEAVEVLEAQLTRLRGKFKADQRHAASQLKQRDDEIERLSLQLQQTKTQAEPLQRDFEKMRTSALLWRAVAHIKMRELDETRQQFSNTSNNLEHKVEMSQQLLKLIQESVKFADELKKTSKEDKEKLEREKEELSLQACQIGLNNDLLKSKVATLEQEKASMQHAVDTIQAVKEQWERERSKLTAQLKLSEEKVDMYREDNENLKTRASVLDRQIHVVEEQLKAAKEEVVIMGMRTREAEAERLFNRSCPLGLFTGEIMVDQLETRVAQNGDNM